MRHSVYTPLTRSVLLNFVGFGVPVIAAVVAMPFIVRGLGVNRFGVLTLAWAIVGYFGLFDLGLGRALTQLISRKTAAGEFQDMPAAIWTALTMMLALGIAGGAFLGAGSHWIAFHVLRAPLEVREESVSAFHLLSFAIPFVTISAGLQGVLEANQRFDLVNSVRLPAGLYTYLAPMCATFFSGSLPLVAALLLIGRILASAALLAQCLHLHPELRRRFAFHRSMVAPLLGFGGWMTVTNLVGPVMVYMDRFIIGAALSVAAVTYYVTPYEVVTKLLLVPGAMIGVLFPVFASTLHASRSDASRLFLRATKYLVCILYPITLVIVAFSKELLHVWLGSDFARQSTPVLQVLAIGVLINSLAYVPFSVVQGAGRTDWTATLHLVELPLYLVAVWVLMHSWGIVGVAVAWTVRVALDAVVLFRIASRLVSPDRTQVWRLFSRAAVLVTCLPLLMLADTFALRLIVAAALTVISGTVVWQSMLDGDDKQWLRRQFTYLSDPGS